MKHEKRGITHRKLMNWCKHAAGKQFPFCTHETNNGGGCNEEACPVWRRLTTGDSK